MIKCSYCGRENVDDAVQCRECGTRLVPEPPPGPKSTTTELSEVSMRRKVLYWILAWAAAGFLLVPPFALFASGGISGLLFAIGMFPLGLLGLVIHPEAEIDTEILCSVGWLIYFSLTTFGLKQKRRVYYFVLYAVLCGLLALNVGGCYFALAHIKM